jgi:hypothetical protein
MKNEISTISNNSIKIKQMKFDCASLDDKPFLGAVAATRRRATLESSIIHGVALSLKRRRGQRRFTSRRLGKLKPRRLRTLEAISFPC